MRNPIHYMLWLALAVVETASAAPAAGDPAAGHEIYQRCAACHSLERDRTGPRHCGLFGRRAGSVPGFDYSDAMRHSNIVWNEQTLDAFLKSPFTYLPGTTMGFAGIKDDADRRDLIAFLHQANESPTLCPAQHQEQN